MFFEAILRLYPPLKKSAVCVNLRQYALKQSYIKD